jgi:diguanylate cyclase
VEFWGRLLDQLHIKDVIATARRCLFILIAASMVVFASLGFERFVFERAMQDAAEKSRLAADISERIALEDERLTMSALMAAQTGDKAWIERYDSFIPGMDKVIAEAKALASPEIAQRFDEQTRVANDALVLMERKAFEAVNSQQLALAQQILQSAEYSKQKDILIDGTDAFLASLNQDLKQSVETVSARGLKVLAAMALATLIGFGLLLRLLSKTLSRSEAEFAHAERRLQMRAMHDDLTGMPNRRTFNEKAGAMVDQAVSSGIGVVAVAMFDIDHFKTVNDSLGHQAGDELIKAMARRVNNALPTGSILARLGGDEFAIALNALDVEAGRKAIDAALAPLKQSFDILGQPLRATTSTGLAIGPVHGGDVSELLRLADVALYRVKDEGRNGVRMFEPDMDEALRAKKDLEQDLREALQKGELGLHYQPLFDAPNAVVSGVEALLRWKHPIHGMVSPGVFIPLAEQSGFIVEMGAAVIGKAFADSKRWPGLSVSINLSPRQMRHKDFITLVQRLSRQHDVVPQQIEFEVTENLLIDENERAGEVFEALKVMGFRIALDDFGTGYSSLGYLRKFAFNKLKIDQSFISGIGESNEAAAIIRTMIGLGRALDMTVTAEGVETVAQRQFLLDAGCKQFQGYLFAKPVPAEQIDKLFKRDAEAAA